MTSTIPMTLTREQAFTFAAWIIAQRSTPEQTGNSGISPTYELILHRFFGAYPPLPGEPHFHAMHARLARGADPVALPQFLSWLYTNARKGPGLRERPQGSSWAFARHVRELDCILSAEQIRPKTAVLPNPVRGRVTPAQAKDALARLEQGERSEEVRLVLEAAVEDWRRRTRESDYQASCPACSHVRVNLLTTSRHLSRCEAHPAYRRLRAALMVARGVALGGTREHPDPVVVRETGPNAFSDPYVYNEKGPLMELEALLAGKPRPLDRDELGTLLVEWEHLIDRSSDPCPHCGAVLQLAAMCSHLMKCEAHPAARRAAEIEAALGAASAMLELAQQHAMFVEELSLLLEATETYESLQNWADGRAYSKPGREELWHAAQGRAVRVLGYPAQPPGVTPSEKSQPARAAFRRLTGRDPRTDAGPTYNADVRLLRDVQSSLRTHAARHGRSMSCPACHRAGVHPGHLHEHLVECRAHPAISRVRRAAAELAARGEAVELPEIARRGIEPLDPRHRSYKWRDEAAESGLGRLEQGKTLQPSEALWLEAIVDEWDDFETGAAARCPGCGDPHGLDGAAKHLMACEQLETHRLAAELERRLATGSRVPFAARLQAEADEHALALAQLADANGSYWNAMREGDRGTSIEDPEQVPMWKAAREEARRVQDGEKEAASWKP